MQSFNTIQLTQWLAFFTLFFTTVIMILFLFKWVLDEKDRQKIQPNKAYIILSWILFIVMTNFIIGGIRYSFPA